MSASPTVIALISWALVFAAGMAGMFVGSRLPEAHRTSDSRNVVSVSMAMVGTLTALVLGLLLSVANSSFRENQEPLMSTSSDLMRMDHLLRLYGPQAEDARRLLPQYASSMLEDVFPRDGRQPDIENEATLDLAAKAENICAQLTPATATQRWLQGRLLEVANDIIQERFRLAKQRHDAIPNALLVLLIFWLALLFGSFGLFAPPHLTSVLVLLLSSAAVSGAILLIIELETPNRGFVYVSAEPLHHAIDVLNR